MGNETLILPPEIVEALEANVTLSTAQVRALITVEAQHIGLTFDRAQELADQRRLPKTPIGVDIQGLFDMLREAEETWSSVPPTTEGYFWLQPKDGKKPFVVELCWVPNGTLWLRSGEPGCPSNIGLAALRLEGCLWAPIPPAPPRP